ncbi:MAG: hypothetical protein ACJARS_004778 [bacterium]|jgi:hypothetical protein
MELWQQVDWQYRPKKLGMRAFARLFRVKMGKSKVLQDIGPALARSKHWVDFDQHGSVYGAVNELVGHLVDTYGLGLVMKDGALHTLDGERSWDLPEDHKLAAKAMVALRQAEPSLEPRPYVKNGESDTFSWAVFSSTDWAELDAGDLYATRALFPLKGKMPKMPKVPEDAAPHRQRDPAHEELLAWVSVNKDELKGQLVDALEKLESSAPDSTEERDAISQIYRIGRRARR